MQTLLLCFKYLNVLFQALLVCIHFCMISKSENLCRISSYIITSSVLKKKAKNTKQLS